MYFYQHHIGDYRRDTSHLSLLEHGIYRQLLDLYYITEKPLDANALRLISARTQDEKDATNLILAEFFTLQDGLYYHSRCEIEINRFKDKSDKAKASADARWNKNKDLQDANAYKTHSEHNANHEPITNNHKPLTNKYIPPIPAELLADFMVIRKAKRLGNVTQTVFNGLQREALKAGLTTIQAITIAVERGWGSFKADWDWKPKQSKSAQRDADREWFVNGGSQTINPEIVIQPIISIGADND